MKLALGTVQFGMPYGIANQAGQTSIKEVANILAHARKSGIDTIDTAINYGESEQRLGEIGVKSWQVVSKLSAVPENCEDVENWVRDSVLGSLERLRINKLHGLLMHQTQQLLGPQGNAIYRALSALKDQGRIEKIGVSIYTPEELDALWPRFQLDIVQAPFNILDRRLATSGWLARLHNASIEVHVRSVFLQGLLLMKAEDRPEYFSQWSSLWDQWHHWLDDIGLTPLQACLGFVLQSQEIGRVVIGVDSLKHLTEIISAAKMEAVSVLASLSTEDIKLLNPGNWVTGEHAAS